MSLKPTPIGPVPELTAFVARAAFPDGNPYLSVRDDLGTFYDDCRFAALFPDRGRPAESPWRLALVTVLQFAEGLSDRQAADAVRGRIDWKYALGLELTDPGFGFSVLCEFRSRLIAGGAERLLLEAMLETCKGHGLLRVRTKQRTYEWFDRYASRMEESRLPKGEEARYAHGEAVGADGFRLLEAVYGGDAPR